MTATPDLASKPPAGTRRQMLSELWFYFSQNRGAVVGLWVTIALVIVALAAPLLAPHAPSMQYRDAFLVPPSWQEGGSSRFLLGTDAIGRDILSRTIVATRLDLGIAVSAVVLSFAVGIALGLAAGYFGGWWDSGVSRLSDTIMAFPLFVLAMGIVAALGNTVGNIVLATAIINLPFYVRVARAEANVRRSAGFIEAARLSGNSDLRILAVHLFPNILPPAMVQVSLNMGWAILNAAGLSFIGLGVRPPTPEWGILVAEGAQFIVSGEWWVSFFPGAVLMLAVFAFNLLGDALRDIFDPRKRT